MSQVDNSYTINYDLYMFFIFPIFGLIFLIVGIIAVIKPDSLMPKVNQTNGKNKTTYQLQFPPMLLRLIGIGMILFSIFFILNSLYIFGF